MMVFSYDDDRLLVILQIDHSRLVGYLAAHWGNERFAEPEPWNSCVLAAQEHDNGWWDWEVRPTLNAQGHPPDYVTGGGIPRDVHVAFDRHGIQRVADRDEYAGLLVSLHQAGLNNQGFGLLPHVLKEIPLEASMFQELRGVSPNVVDVHYPSAGANAFLVVVAMTPKTSGESRAVLEKLLEVRTRGKYNIIVDADVDIFDLEQLWHAVSTRSQPAADSIIVPDLPCVPLDPSAENGKGSAIGIDATRPVGRWFPTAVRTSGWPNLDRLIDQSGGSDQRGYDR